MKSKIINAIKLFLLMLMMTNGFFLTYSSLWVILGFDLTDLAICVSFALACLSEFGYIKWVSV